MPTYHLRLMFEWGGGCLWCDNDAARDRFDVGPIEDRLPLSQGTQDRLEELSDWHDQSLNWDDPREQGPWDAEEYERFAQAAQAMLKVIQGELGSDFAVCYKPL